MKRANRVLWLSDAAPKTAARPRLDSEMWVVSDAQTESDAIAMLSWGDVDLVIIEEPWNLGGTVLKHLMNTEDAPALVHVVRGTNSVAPESMDGPPAIAIDKLQGSWGATLEEVMVQHRLVRFVRRAARGESGRLDATAIQIADVLRAAARLPHGVHIALEGPRGKGSLSVLSAESVELSYGAAVGADALFLTHLVPPTWLVSLAQAPTSRSAIVPGLPLPTMLGELGKQWPQWLRLASNMPSLDAVLSVGPGVQVPAEARACLRNPSPLAENLMHVAQDHLQVLRAISGLHQAGTLRSGETAPPASSAMRGGHPYRRVTQEAMVAQRPAPVAGAAAPGVAGAVVASQAAPRAAAVLSSVPSTARDSREVDASELRIAPVIATLAPPKVSAGRASMARGTLLGFGAKASADGVAPVGLVGGGGVQYAPTTTPASEPAALHTVSVPAPVPQRALVRSEAPSSDDAPQTARSLHLAASLPPDGVKPASSTLRREAMRPTLSAPPAGSTPRLPDEEPSVVVLESLPPSSRTSGIVRDAAGFASDTASPSRPASALVAVAEAPGAPEPAPEPPSAASLKPATDRPSFARTRGAMTETFVSERRRSPKAVWAVSGGAVLVAVLAGGLWLRTRSAHQLQRPNAGPAPTVQPVAATPPVIESPAPEKPPLVAEGTAAPKADAAVVADTRPLWSHRELEVALDRGLPRRVVEEGQRVIAAHPEDAVAWEMLGVAYRALGKRAEARAAFTSCAEHAKGTMRAECTAFAK